MITLTKASVSARKGIRYTLFAIILLIIGRFALAGGLKFYKSLLPEPKPKATSRFGALPLLPFEDKYSDIEKLNYKLETVDGKLPQIPEVIEVYFMPRPLSSIVALDNAKSIARKLDFNPNGRELVETVYLFSKDNLPSTMSMNIVSGAFSISYDVNSDPFVFDGLPPTAPTATSTIKKFLASANLLKDLEGNVSHKFLRVEGGELVPAVSLSEANVTEINLHRSVYGANEISAATSDPKKSNVWFLLSTKSRNPVIIAGEYHYFPIDPDTFSTYDIKTSQLAWEELLEGKAVIASVDSTEGTEISVREIYLSYYDAGQYTEFYQPIFVFEGDNDFIAYLPAITDEFYGRDE
jgi:hypothetical protein